MNRGHIEHHGSPDHVHTDAHGITQIVRNFFGGGTRAQDTLLAFSVLVNILLAVLLYGAWKDLQTQIWLRSDALSKENAELRAQIMTNNALLQAYGISKTIREK